MHAMRLILVFLFLAYSYAALVRFSHRAVLSGLRISRSSRLVVVPLFASSPRAGVTRGRTGGSGARRENVGGGEKDSIRQSRVSRALRDELTNIICDIDIKATIYPSEGLLRATSIVDVEISPDLSYAKVFISVLGNSVEKRQVYVWLCENVGQVRYSLAKRLRHMKRVPDILFKMADSQAQADLVALIEEIVPRAIVEDEEEYDEFEEVEEE